MGMFIPMMIFSTLVLTGLTWIIVWQIRSNKAEAHRWIERK
jgi:hypothetical protein